MACAKYLFSDNSLNSVEIKAIIKRALAEDIGWADITTSLCIPKNKLIKARIIAKADFLLCGIDLAGQVFKALDPSLNFYSLIKDGKKVFKNNALAIISGKARSILTAERVALNLLSLLSGIATKTAKFVKKIEPLRTKIIDTRKTIAGLRSLQKYAVRVGGGYNHRMRLDEMLLIKDNHLKIMGDYRKLPKAPKGKKLEIEAQSLKEFNQALNFRPDIIMLDNMTSADILKAVKIRNNLNLQGKAGYTWLEASGGMHLGNIKKYASTGVDMISIGQLTDSVESADISLEVV